MALDVIINQKSVAVNNVIDHVDNWAVGRPEVVMEVLSSTTLKYVTRADRGWRCTWERRRLSWALRIESAEQWRIGQLLALSSTMATLENNTPSLTARRGLFQ